MIKIVESREKDLEALRSLFLKERLTTFYYADTSRFQLSDFDTETENEYILVALYDELLVGFVSVWAADNFIHHLYVDEKFQHQQIGTKLINEVADKFGYPIRLKCLESNTKALFFYKRKGFVEIEKGPSDMGSFILLELNNIEK